MQTTKVHTLRIEGMTCEHCVKTITEALQARDPAADVKVKLQGGEARVVSSLLYGRADPARCFWSAIAMRGDESAPRPRLPVRTAHPTQVPRRSRVGWMTLHSSTK